MLENKLRERLYERRTELGLTLDELSEGSGISKSTLSRYETGEIRDLKMNNVYNLADFLKVSVVWLLGWSDIKYVNKEKKDTKKRLIPLLGIIHAGTPMYAEENIEEYLSCEDTECDYALRVKGNSMIGARIWDGDIAYIRKQDDVDSGEIGVCIIDDDEATLKRIYKYGNKIVLHPENPSMKDMEFTKSDKSLKIIGKLIKVEFKAK